MCLASHLLLLLLPGSVNSAVVGFACRLVGGSLFFFHFPRTGVITRSILYMGGWGAGSKKAAR
jgi:hypothetical protein